VPHHLLQCGVLVSGLRPLGEHLGKRNYGPTIAVYRFNEAQPDRLADLDGDFLSFLTVWNQATELGKTAYLAEYLLVTATKAVP